MALFRYEAADAAGKVLRGAMDAPTTQEVHRRLSEKGFRNVRIVNPPAPGGTVTGTVGGVVNGGRVASAAAVPIAVPKSGKGISFAPIPRSEDIGLFFRQMASLAQAGFTVSASLADLGPRTAQRGLRDAAMQMARDTASGLSFAACLSQYPNLFAPHVVGLVAAGETGGFVPFAFEEAALGAEQDAALKQGLWWPKFLTWQGVWSVLLFAPLFPSLDLENIGASAGRYARATLLLTILVGIPLHGLTWLIGWMRHQPFARDGFDALSLRLPVFRRVARTRALAAFTRVLRRLLMSGVSVEPAYVGAAQSVPNAALRAKLLAGVSIVRAGRGVDEAVEASGLMDFDPLQMLVTGQRTGQWMESLDRVTAWYQEEAARATEAAKSAQKRAGVLIAIITSGYVTIAATHGLMTMGFKLTDKWATQDQ